MPSHVRTLIPLPLLALTPLLRTQLTTAFAANGLAPHFAQASKTT